MEYLFLKRIEQNIIPIHCLSLSGRNLRGTISYPKNYRQNINYYGPPFVLKRDLPS
ncbi:hypothetical protein NPIL_387261, partial [Nephila pilipes]